MASFPIFHPATDWKIYYETYHNGKKNGSGIYWKSYKHKSSAVRAAKQIFDNKEGYSPDGPVTYKWSVGQTRPEKGE